MTRWLDDSASSLGAWELGSGDAWRPATVPGTVAGVVGAVPELDESDWSYRVRFPRPKATAPRLRFGGLATIAEVWLNGVHVLDSTNMFVEHVLEGLEFADDNELLLRFRALGPELKKRRARPRWRTRLVPHTGLRWWRTTLMGRMPGWCPEVAPVGPWRKVELEDAAGAPKSLSLTVSLEAGDGVVHVSGVVDAERARLVVGDVTAELEIADGKISGSLRLPNPALWWPHTHGSPSLYPARIELVGARTRSFSFAPIGFRSLHVDVGEDFGVSVNAVPVFCRGAVWTPDLVMLDRSESDLRASLQSLCDAGMNMVRVGGTMIYESDAFYRLCDELGILVWQDFMFANMDYPVDDAAFRASVEREAAEVCARLVSHPSLALLCGGSEVEQQAAMLGLSPEQWRGPLSAQILPAATGELAYVPSTPWSPGTSLPFRVDVGVSHYFGVGAYLRDLPDARRAGVRFAAECLAFSHVPDDDGIDRTLADGQAPGHHPAWKAGVPRDVGPGWDFEDVRDHYVERLFGVDAQALRAVDSRRWLELGRVATGWTMARTFGEWRRQGSPTRGALVWLWRDVRPGAGWGLVDELGRPKPAWWIVRRALQPQTLLATDEGSSGVRLHAINDRPSPLVANLVVSLYRDHETMTLRGERALVIPPHGVVAVDVEDVIGRFCDSAWAYRFGPPGHDVVAARLLVDGRCVASVLHLPPGAGASREALSIDAEVIAVAEGFGVRMSSARLALGVVLTAPGFTPDDNYFDLEPGIEKIVRLRGAGRPQVTLTPLNARVPSKARP